MINGNDAIVEEFVLHRLITDDAPSIFNDFSAVLQGAEEQEFLRRLFLKPFGNAGETFTFAEGEDGDVFHGLCTGIRAGRDLVEASQSIAQRLLEVLRQHEIKGGDCFVAKFSGVELAGARHDALGVLKFDGREVFIESRPDEGGGLTMRLGRGLGTLKPDLAVLVVFTPNAPTVLTLDNERHANAWRNGFIGLRRKEDHVNTTRDVMAMARSFITEQLPQVAEVDRAGQIDLLNRSVQYFKENAEYDRDHFAQEVFVEKDMIRSFDRYGEQYGQAHDVQLQDRFDISTHAVKSQARVFKSVLKLDKNFHIYIHGDRQKIERGVDDNGRKYYKIYYEEER
ncbi:MAG: nucleoid-associated protein [Flavobacteriales bacterium]|jgi:hypothetical protein|nr:nucleoid-associated protein [Flavobacteriales bacterium]